MLLIYCFFLCGSVVLCYFIALASVYGNSVVLLRAQLKLASSFDFFFLLECFYYKPKCLLMGW